VSAGYLQAGLPLLSTDRCDYKLNARIVTKQPAKPPSEDWLWLDGNGSSTDRQHRAAATAYVGAYVKHQRILWKQITVEALECNTPPWQRVVGQ